MVYNGHVSSTPPPTDPRPSGLHPTTAGTAYCIVAALAYTAANICLRHLSSRVDQVWITCLKESVTVAAVGPWVVWQGSQGRRLWPRWQIVVLLALTGLAVELVGNLGFIWAMNVIGLCRTVPTVFAVNLAFSALLGWLVLREGVTPRTLAAVTLLIGGIVMLKWGTGPTQTTIESWRTGAALGAACLSGVVFATMAVALRRSMTDNTPTSIAMLMITGMGVITLGPLSLARLGLDGLLATPAGDLAIMFLSGVLNLVGFFSITRGLRVASVVRANMLNASQVAMATLAGLWIFGEPLTKEVLLGIALTILGILLVQRPPRKS